MMRASVTLVLCVLSCAEPARALAAEGAPAAFATPTLVFGDAPAEAADRAHDAWHVDFGAAAQTLTADAAPSVSPLLDLAAAVPADDAQAVRRPVAYVYSDGYQLRAKIHKYASFATLPIFGAQYLLGRKLDDGTGSETVRATHAAIATTMVGLFGVNTVTGVWNLWEGRENPAGRTRRLIHAILMLGSDAGFVATGMLAPTNDGGGNRQLHKAVAITSMGVASAGYLLMLLTQ